MSTIPQDAEVAYVPNSDLVHLDVLPTLVALNAPNNFISV